jgi:HEAT repeat protein
MGLFGPPDVEKMEAKRDVKGLIRALGYRKNSWKHRGVRRAAARALGQIGGPRAVEPLIAALKDVSWDVRDAATWALRQIGDPRAVKPLAAALKDRREDVHRVAEFGDVSVVEPLIAALKDSDEYVRKAAAGGLGRIGDARAVEPLCAALKDRGVNVRWVAAEALDKLGWKPDRNETGATYWIIKRNMYKCVEIGAPAVEPLIAALKGIEEYRVKQAVVAALGEIGDARAVEPLIAALWGKECLGLGSDVVAALGEIGDARAVEPLSAALKDTTSRYVRQAASEALDKLGWKPHKNETGAIYWITKREWDKCVEIGAPAVEPLIAALENEDLQVRQAAAGALVEMYRMGQLDEVLKQLVLAQRGIIMQNHSDSTGHDDHMGGCFGDIHEDTETHQDAGIGVYFPL